MLKILKTNWKIYSHKVFLNDKTEEDWRFFSLLEMALFLSKFWFLTPCHPSQLDKPMKNVIEILIFQVHMHNIYFF